MSSTKDLVRHGADRFKQEHIGKALWNEIYVEIFGPCVSVQRNMPEEYDIEFGIDVALHLFSMHGATPFPIYVQEKTLGYFWGLHYDTLTVEFEQVAHTGERKPVFANVYACGYLTEDEAAISHGVVVDWLALLKYPGLPWHYNQNYDGQARASFAYIDIDDIPEEAKLWRRTK